METLTTNNITVSVETEYLAAHSNPREGKYIFGYHITIENRSPHTVQLLRRYWFIQDSDGIQREVEGDGVVGQQPVLAPGEIHGYSSFCNLDTPIGKMSGNYLMERAEDSSTFHASIPEFQMIAPFILN
ncbi:MAG: Co2+/Mg2+ efflux protein ApaG [Bacteroidetes bacterium]|nr:MAG: Co2+/Mg2+ efflux protein ApaG [Bacteroidota bacterium]